MPRKVEFFRHNIAQEDIDQVISVLHSIFLTTGPKVAEFEKKLASFLGVADVVALSSCTGALHLALLHNGVGPGNEVITTPMTFVATVAAILEAGATPVFVDINPRSGLVEPEQVEKAITPRTKALLPVHLYGRMVDMEGFARLAEKYDLALIEDSAHCIEGLRGGNRPGQKSRAACFSFYATKNITCGEGGALACQSLADAEQYRALRHHGISKNASTRYVKRFVHWDMEMLGWKYNMDDIQAALLLCQLDRIGQLHQKRVALEKIYRNRLSKIEELDLLERPGPGEVSAHHMFTVLLPRRVPRDQVVERLQDAGIGCAVNYRAVHTLKFFRDTFHYSPSDFPAAFDMGNRTITLPLYPKLEEQEVELVCQTLERIIQEA